MRIVNGLIADLEFVLSNIDHTINEIKRTYPSPYTLVDSNGRFMMVDLLAAKANALVAVSQLEREAGNVQS